MVVLVCSILAGCGSTTKGTAPDTSPDRTDVTADPALLPTFQAGLAQTAAWVSTLTPPAPTAPTQAVLLAPLATGTPLSARVGECPTPGGFTVYERDGYCISAPSTWEVFNVDGGMAAFLNTTPGQAISIQPDWAETTAECHLMVYVTPEHDVAAYLSSARDQLATRADLSVLSPIAEQPIGDIGLYGFSYADTSGVQGSIYAILIDVNRLLRISIGGSNCPVDSFVPTLETMRFK